MAEVRLEHVWKRFKGKRGAEIAALKDASLGIEDGEFFVLVGPSGSGKSTILRLIAGLETVSEGEIYIGGRLVNDVPPRERDIAMTFQSYALYPHMDVYNNTAWGLGIRHTVKDEIARRIKETASLLGLHAYLDRKPRTLSGGQRQRVALGRAITREPAVFLLDEPLSNLDLRLRAQARAQLMELHQRLRATMVYVTHDQVDAMTMATRVAVLKEGVVQQVGSPQGLYTRPINKFVAGFIGSPPMNFFDVRVVKSGEEVVLQGECFTLTLLDQIAPRIREVAGSEAILGIRPEYLEDAELAGPKSSAFGLGTIAHPGIIVPMKVENIERTGKDLVVYLSCGTQRSIVASVTPRSNPVPGGIMQILFNIEYLHLFDKSNEKALL